MLILILNLILYILYIVWRLSTGMNFALPSSIFLSLISLFFPSSPPSLLLPFPDSSFSFSDRRDGRGGYSDYNNGGNNGNGGGGGGGGGRRENGYVHR